MAASLRLSYKNKKYYLFDLKENYKIKHGNTLYFLKSV
jgi:hypothetical protein